MNTVLELMVLSSFSSYVGCAKEFDIKTLPEELEAAIRKLQLRCWKNKTHERIFLDYFLPAFIFYAEKNEFKEFSSLKEFVSLGANGDKNEAYTPDIWKSDIGLRLGEGYELYRSFAKQINFNRRYLKLFLEKKQGKIFLKWWLRKR